MGIVRCFIWLAVFLMPLSYLTSVHTKECSILKIEVVVLNVLPAFLGLILLLKKMQFPNLLHGSEQIQRAEGVRC